jgi:Fe-S-cluster-containing hydrogenase component 2
MQGVTEQDDGRKEVKAVVVVDKGECTGCETCVDICPVEAISMADSIAQIDMDTCTECESCVAECPVEAIKIK